MIKGKYLCVYCGASERVDPSYYDLAEKLGKLIATNDFNLVYGGGRNGLMGRVSNSVIEHGGIVMGVTTEQLDEREGVQNGLHELHVVDTMHARKMKMFLKADAFIIMPGGYGTLDEFFEVLTWKQLGIHNKPIIIANLNNYWDTLLALYDHIIATDFARKDQATHIQVATSLDEVIEIAKKSLK
jgi:uncharacterized protein (TIGR00730 family)